MRFKRYWPLWILFIVAPASYELAAVDQQRRGIPEALPTISELMWEINVLYPDVKWAVLIVVATLILHFWVTKKGWVLALGLILGLGLGARACLGA